MAKSTKSRGKPTSGTAQDPQKGQPEDIQDAVVISEEPATPAADDTAKETEVSLEDVESKDVKPASTAGDPDNVTAGDSPPTSVDDTFSKKTESPDTQAATPSEPDQIANTASDAVTPEEPAAKGDSVPENEPATTADVPPHLAPVVQEKVIIKKSGFFPALLGGVVAAAIGFGGAQVLGPDYWLFGKPEAPENPFEAETTVALQAQSEQLGALSGRIDAAESAVAEIDTASLASAIDGQASAVADLQASLTGVADSLGTLDLRLTTLEKRPITEAVSPEAIAAYERELAALREDITIQRTEIQQLASEAVAAEQEATEQANLAQARTALAEVISAVENGASYVAPLTVIQQSSGIEVPSALSTVAAAGVPSLQSLLDEFPDLARDALGVARRNAGPETDAEQGGLGGFLKAQLGARSVVPREGNDPDAILSRVEAAVKNGDLETALAEISALPQPAQDVLSDWRDRVGLRAAAQQAAAQLAQQLNTNE